MKIFLGVVACVFLLVSGCGSNSIYIGDTELAEHDLKLILSNLPGTVMLTSAHESESVIKEGPKEYSNLVVVTKGRIRIAGKVFTNDKPVIISIVTGEHFAPGESREIGTDYFVFLVPAHAGKHFEVMVSKHHPDWAGYFTRGGGSKPRGYSANTWKLLGYFHVSPQGKVLRNSVVTNANLHNPGPGVPLPGMVKVDDFAIDIYENSEINGHCVSVFGRTPLTSITRDEAQMLAKMNLKKLPTSRQWIMACEPETYSQILSAKPKEGEGAHNIWTGQVAMTGFFASKHPDNLSSTGCVDMVGNVWEWCEEVIDFANVDTMPAKSSGYIVEVVKFIGIDCWPSVVSRSRPVGSQGYFAFDDSLGSAGIARGASCSDGDKAGTASLLINVAREQSSSKVGFRCTR